MNTLIETRGVSLRLPSLPTNPLPILPMQMVELRENFTTFNRSLDLTPIKYKLMKDKDWTLDRANQVEPQYKAFLFLIGSRVKAEFVPTFDIDEMWHMHILDTRKYMTDCARYFGVYIHHYPYLGMKDANDHDRAEDLFSATCATIGDAFGINIHDLDATSCGGGGCGGHGCGGHGCSGGHSSCGAGHSDSGTHGGHGSHHDRNDSDDSGITSIISSCSSGGDEKERKRRQPSDDDSSKIPSFWRRIFGLSPLNENGDWYVSVTPEFFDSTEYRPDATDLQIKSQGVN